MDSVDLSIIIVTLNTRDLLRRALVSVRESSDLFRKEIIVVDNGSNDGTMEMVTGDFPEVIYLRQPRNLGFAQANNRGVRHAQGGLLCLMNSDARLKAETLNQSVQFMNHNPACGVMGVQLLNTDGTRQNSVANFPNLTTELINKSLLRRLDPERFPGKNILLTEPLEVESVIGAFFLTRHDLWNRLMGLDERYFFFLEETDYCFRVREAGFTTCHLPNIEVWHDQGQTAKKVHVPARIEYWRSRYTYFDQHHPRLHRWLLTSGLIVRLGVGLLGNALLSPLRAKFREKAALQLKLLLWHLRGCPASWGLSVHSRTKKPSPPGLAHSLPMKVIQVNSMLSGGGTDDQCLKLSKGIQELGCAVILAGPSKAELSQAVLRRGIPLHLLARTKLSFIWGLAALLKKTRPEIVQVHHGRDYWPTILACWFSGIKTKLVISRHLAKSPSSWLSKKFLLDNCDACVAVSQYVARVLTEGVYEPESPVVERRARPPISGNHQKIRVIYGGIDMEKFRPQENRGLREAWQLAKEHFVFAVAGAYDFPVGKGQREFLQAAALIHEQFPLARFLIIGRGTMREELLTDIHRLGLLGKASLTPYCQDMPAAMNALDCLVHPAQGTEAFGLVLIEAFACGKQVIATRLDGIPEAFGFCPAGDLIDSLDPLTLAQAMREIMEAKAHATAPTTYADLRQRFSLQTMAKNYLALYQELIREA